MKIYLIFEELFARNFREIYRIIYSKGGAIASFDPSWILHWEYRDVAMIGENFEMRICVREKYKYICICASVVNSLKIIRLTMAFPR